ncbi:MAG: recombinase family protein [Anaerolineales bacterium]|nr:recombinase family protein [Anaerolineales bacterium]
MGTKDRHQPIELDPERAAVWREAWNLLLADRYTLKEICLELHRRGHTRGSGLPWVWKDPKTGKQKYATSHLSGAFHNPFYCGWVTSKAYGIKRGEVRGNWKPLISEEDFDTGLAILTKRDSNKCRRMRYVYLLGGLLYMRVNE